MILGNGLWGSAKFNSRIQVTELGLGNSATDASVWKTVYEYGELDANGNVDTAKNTGNIARQTLTVPGTSFVQSYRYDSLYRLTEAVEKTGAETNWSQAFNYDRYGNRIAIEQAIGSLILNTTPAVDENTNRFTSTDFGYDKNGNVINDIDPLSTLPRQFIFNGDNKQTEVKRDGVPIGRYYYDGEGKRVKKVTDTETTVFVYSAGKLIAEYSTVVAAPEQAKTAYTTTDHLGTPRIITDQLGQVRSRRDFMPFGEELYTGIGARSASLNYGTSEDDIRQKFTGYQKDNEIGLDFAEARMYENRFGRFTAVDPLMSSGRSDIPQTWNRYVYCLNNPIMCTDPTGLDGGIWAMQFNGSGVDLRYFESEEAMREENRIGNTEFCRQNGCNLWERYDRTYFLWDDQTASHLGGDGVRTDFDVATVGQEYWDGLVRSFYSESGFSQGEERLLQSLYEGQLRQDKMNRILGLSENPNHLEMGGNPLKGAKQISRLVRKYTVGEYDQLRKAAAGSGLTAHHVPQKAIVKRFIVNYDPGTAPSILVPRAGHIIKLGDRGILSRNTEGFTNARQVLARDIMELRRMYPDLSNTELRQIILLNRTMYPKAFLKPPK